MKWKQREILFRGKKECNDKWIYGYYCPHPHTYGNFMTKDWAPCRVYPETVGQYTGRTDIGKNKIFEGDIVDVLPYPNQRWVGYVEYRFSGFQVRLIDIKGNSLTEGLTEDCLIKGNVFQNPELIKKYKLEI